MQMVLSAQASGQPLDQQRAAVVKVTSVVDGKRKTGTGFVVRMEGDTAYILTASHVVEGDNHPQVAFFARQNVPVEADTARIEGGDPRGLALLLVRGKDKLPPGLVALPFAQGASLSGGEQVTAIGFPQGGGPWAVARADVVSRVGRDLTLAGPIDEGNSGGPVLRNDGAVVAVVTGVNASFALATPVAIASLTLEGWGVKPVAVSGVGAGVETVREPSAAPASGTAQGGGALKILYTSCEKLRAGTSFRVTVRGEAQGPAGASVRVGLAVGDKETSTPKVSCTDWDACRRQPAAPEKTRWAISTIILRPVPDMAIVSLEPNAAAGASQPYAIERVALDCRYW
jgi:hypothetical protein